MCLFYETHTHRWGGESEIEEYREDDEEKTTYDNGIGLMVWAEQLKRFTTKM